MKLRATSDWLRETQQAGDLIGVSRTEVVRRALRQYLKAGSVNLASYIETATRENSTPVRLDVDDLRGGLTGKEICAVTRWALSRRKNVEPKPDIRPSEPVWIEDQYLTP